MMRVPVVGVAVTAALCAGVVRWLRRRWMLVTVDGPSMLPALAPGVRVLAYRVTPAAVRTGDIVVADWPPGGRVIKRVAAVPGDRVPAGSVLGAVAVPGVRVPAGMVVLLGDNAADSTDSRMRGYCPAARILGVVRDRPASTAVTGTRKGRLSR